MLLNLTKTNITLADPILGIDPPFLHSTQKKWNQTRAGKKKTSMLLKWPYAVRWSAKDVPSSVSAADADADAEGRKPVALNVPHVGS